MRKCHLFNAFLTSSMLTYESGVQHAPKNVFISPRRQRRLFVDVEKE